MAETIERLKNASDIIKNIFEIGALLAAGIWAFFTFFVKDRPALEAHADIRTQLVWHTRGKDCIADWNVSVKNIGTSSFDVTGVDLKMWKVDPDQLPDEQFVNVNVLQQAGPTNPNDLKLTKSGSSLVGHYAPGLTDGQSFEWVFKKENPSKWIVFTVDVFRDERPFPWLRTRQASLTHAYEWDEMCPPEEKKTQ